MVVLALLAWLQILLLLCVLLEQGIRAVRLQQQPIQGDLQHEYFVSILYLPSCISPIMAALHHQPTNIAGVLPDALIIFTVQICPIQGLSCASIQGIGWTCT